MRPPFRFEPDTVFEGNGLGGPETPWWAAPVLSQPVSAAGAARGRGRFDATEEDAPVVVHLGRGADRHVAETEVDVVSAGRGSDHVVLEEGGGEVRLGRGHDTLEVSGDVESVHGGRGFDTLVHDRALSDFDVSAAGRHVLLVDRLTGETTDVRSVESFVFAGETVSLEDLRADFAAGQAIPTLQVGADAQTVTVNDVDPTVSVVWNRVVQEAVVSTEAAPVGPTVASRAYAMMHTAMYDAWATFDATAERVSFDAEGDDAALAAAAAGLTGEAAKIAAMSHAAFAVLSALFPDMTETFETVMRERYGLDPAEDGLAAEIGRDAASDLLALRLADGSNQAGGYAGDYAPVNPNPLEVVDIARWTPESVPIDPEDASPEQSFLTPQWMAVEGFALPETADGATDFDAIRPVAPEPFFAAGFEGSVLDMAAGAITLSAAAEIEGVAYAAGETVAVSKALIGTVINPGFIAQAEQVVEISAGLTDEEKIIAEFWEDGGGTPFPPGTFMSFGEFVSARDGHSLEDDAKLFMALGSAVFDAGIAAWEAKVEYDYVRPVRAIRDLGELGLIGEWGVDEITGEEGWVIEAFGGWDPETGEGRGTSTILAENFVTYQRPGGDPSPPFAEYVSGHSSFSAAGAEVLRLFTGSDAFGGSVTFAPGSTLFDHAVPYEETTLAWDTFTEAADEAGISRLYGGIHFEDGDLNGRTLGRTVGEAAFETAALFWNGEATDADRPFFGDDLLFA
jgi:hypothetical protein